jgi:hypothetical protein
MPTTIIYGDKTSTVSDASPEGENLWLPLNDLRDTTGWELKAEGVCQGDVCIPIPPGRRDEFVRRDNSFNLGAFARLREQPRAHDDARAVWFFGEAPAARHNRLMSLQAPDFTLPDIDGNAHSLADYRGNKVLLLSWASW